MLMLAASSPSRNALMIVEPGSPDDLDLERRKRAESARVRSTRGVRGAEGSAFQREPEAEGVGTSWAGWIGCHPCQSPSVFWGVVGRSWGWSCE